MDIIFRTAYIEMPSMHRSVWRAGLGLVTELMVRGDVCNGQSVGVCSQELSVVEINPNFTLLPAQAGMGMALPENVSGMSQNTHYATLVVCQEPDQAVGRQVIAPD
jgi:hypothetical protein